jgi:O-methyltransferase
MHPEVAATFNRSQTERTQVVAEAVVGAYDFSRFGALGDVGGGYGTLLLTILQAPPMLRGIVFDRVHAVEGARQTIAAHGCTERCEAVAGDFFQAVASGGDAYLLKSVLTDWDDARSPVILRNCRRAAPQARLLVVEPATRQSVSEENARAAVNRGSDVCKQGYVWREASPSDYVCAEPAVREQARRDNAAHNTRERILSVICDQYSREAVAQFHEMQARNCGFSGDRWSDYYDGHSVWCQTAAPRDRNGEAGARRAQLRDCGARAPSQSSPLPNEQCSVSVVVCNRSCMNPDGTPSSLPPGGSTAPGCGGNVENARARARLNFVSTFASCISDDDPPPPECCTVSEETVDGCLCR